MNYGQCRKYLEHVQSLGVKLGLENVRSLLSVLGNPQDHFPSLLVAGTNGKGSVCAILSTILGRHGFRVGLYTSPHLIRVEERIRIRGESISSRSFCRILTVLKEIIDRLMREKELPSHPTYFEVLTCLAFLYFKEKEVDIAVLEVGMGGRLDATNVVTPLLSVITTISRDHQKFLGESLREIAGEKAGVIKPEIPVICGVENREALSVIKKKANALSAPFFEVFGREARFSAKKGKKTYRFLFEYDGKKYMYSPALPGLHQGENAAIAIAASAEVGKRWKRLQKERILQGVEETKWEGRLEVVSRRPLLLLDGAHNEEGAKALAAYIQDFVPSPLVLVFAIMKDKEIRPTVRRLFSLAEHVILTRIPYNRAALPDDILKEGRLSKSRVTVEPDIAMAMKKARVFSGRNGAILVAGSLFLVGEVKKLLRT